MAIDLNSKEGRKKFITEYLDDLLVGINESYGPILLEELQKRLEFTINEFNEEITEAFSMLKKRDKDRKAFFKDTIEEVVDAVVTMEVVTNIFKATRVKDKKFWTFPDIDLTELRQLRSTIENKGAIKLVLRDSKN